MAALRVMRRVIAARARLAFLATRARAKLSSDRAMTKASKYSVNYSRGHRDSHCGKSFDGDRGFCRHFRFLPGSRAVEKVGACTKVSGDIKAMMWCKLFARASLPIKNKTDALPAPR